MVDRIIPLSRNHSRKTISGKWIYEASIRTHFLYLGDGLIEAKVVHLPVDPEVVYAVINSQELRYYSIGSVEAAKRAVEEQIWLRLCQATEELEKVEDYIDDEIRRVKSTSE
jgi:hypothetical protein